MAFPSFTIRRTGAEMLYFHFPRVSNSRWPGDAFSSVLLYEHFTTWSITFLEHSSSPNVTGPTSTFSMSPSVLEPAPLPRHTYSHIHSHARAHGDIYECTQKHWEMFLDAVNERCSTVYLLSFLRKSFLIATLKKKKKRKCYM